MSITDTLAPFVSSAWPSPGARPRRVRPLPGLRPEISKSLKFSTSGLMCRDYRDFLSHCSGLAGTDIGHIDFTGAWYPVEECPVFYPCLTLALDEMGRRWISEVSETGFPGRVWCLFAEPQVAVLVSEDLPSFIARLREKTGAGQVTTWLLDLCAQARAIWEYRRAFALRPYQSAEIDSELAAWLKTLPADAYVYDLREPKAICGWPYGFGGPAGRLFRYGSLPVFAVAGPNSDESRSRDPATLPSPTPDPKADGAVLPFPPKRREREPDRPDLVTARGSELRACA